MYTVFEVKNMKKLSVTESDYGTGVEIPFDTRFREPFNELSTLGKGIEKFIYDFNITEGYGQLNPSAQTKFKDYYRAIIKNIIDLKTILQTRPPKLSKLDDIFKRLRKNNYLSFFRQARMNPKFPQEIRRWEAVLKKIEGLIRKYSIQFPSIKEKIQDLFPVLYQNLNNLLNLINI